MARPRSKPPASPETKTAKSTNNKERVRFVFEPDRNSPNGITFSWLIHKTYSGKEKAATATRAFWLPFAYLDSSDYSEAELKEVAQQSIWRLEEQIQHLREAFGLDKPLRPAHIEADPYRSVPALAHSSIPEVDIAAKSSRVGINSVSLPETESSQPNILSTMAATEDAAILDEFGDAV